jgi:glycosyltransferase involved in cell wall biosynthesis
MTSHGTEESYDAEFQRAFAWDIPMLAGYPHRFLEAHHGAKPGAFWSCRLKESLATRMKECGATAIWIQGWNVFGYWQAVYAARKLGLRVWVRGESNTLSSRSFLAKAARRAKLQLLFGNIHTFFYIGSANRDLYLECRIDESRLAPAPYAVDNHRFANQANELRPSRTAIRQRWEIPTDSYCILFCGKFITKKRPMDLVEAVCRLLETCTHRTIHILFVGSGPLDLELRRACNTRFDSEALGESGGVTRPAASFVGFLNQSMLCEAYVAADCLVLPSDSGETWGLVVNEALAAGLPCVVSDACGCARDLAPHSTFACGNIADLCSKLVTVMRGNLRLTLPPSFQDTVDSVIKVYNEH